MVWAVSLIGKKNLVAKPGPENRLKNKNKKNSL